MTTSDAGLTLAGEFMLHPGKVLQIGGDLRRPSTSDVVLKCGEDWLGCRGNLQVLDRSCVFSGVRRPGDLIFLIYSKDRGIECF